MTIALIGYTNAGKSAILNSLAKNDVVESRDMLFQTLSTKAKKINIKNNMDVILVDTIGFINNLPHEMIAAFMSTLEHLKYADVILHIRDISHPMSEQQNETVKRVIKKIGMGKILASENYIEVRNKVDLFLKMNPEQQLAQLEDSKNVIHVSAREKINLDKLRNLIFEKIQNIFGCLIHTFAHSFEDHQSRIAWLQEQTNTNEFFDFECTEPCDEEPQGKYSFKAIVSSTILERYYKSFPGDKKFIK